MIIIVFLDNCVFKFNVFCNVVFEELFINNFLFIVKFLIFWKVFWSLIVNILFIRCFFKNIGYFLELIFLVLCVWVGFLFNMDFFGLMV